MKNKLNVFQTVTKWRIVVWNGHERKYAQQYGPDFIAKDLEAVQQLINYMGYKVVDILTWVCDVQATPMPVKFDPTNN